MEYFSKRNSSAAILVLVCLSSRLLASSSALSPVAGPETMVDLRNAPMIPFPPSSWTIFASLPALSYSSACDEDTAVHQCRESNKVS